MHLLLAGRGTRARHVSAGLQRTLNRTLCALGLLPLLAAEA